VVICDDVGLDVLVDVLREQMGLPADHG